MDAENHSPRQWAIDILNPQQPLTLLAFQFIKEMTQVEKLKTVISSGTHGKTSLRKFAENFLSPNG